MVDRRCSVKCSWKSTKDICVLLLATSGRVSYRFGADLMRRVLRKLQGLRESDRSQSLASERRERLEYLADLLSELQVLAEREGCEKLADLISLSRAEALEESLSGRP